MGWFHHLKMPYKLLIIIMMVTLFSGAGTVLAVYNLLELNNIFVRHQQETDWVTGLQGIQHDFSEANQNAGFFLLTGSNYYSSLHQSLLDGVQESIREAALQNAASLEKKQDLEQLSKHIESYSNDSLAIFHHWKTQAQPTDSIQLLEESASQAQSQFNSMVVKSQVYLQQEVESAARQLRVVIWSAALGLLLLILAVFLGAMTINRLTEPLLYLTNAVVAFENKAFTPGLLQEYTGFRDEIGQLVNAFISMSRTLTLNDQEQQAFISAARRFVPNEFIEFLDKNDITDIRLGDHVSAEMAILFSDVRGFTTISEAMTPQENFDFVNHYFARVSPLVKENNGFIVKYLGDGMMAIFPYGADDALLCAVEKQQQVNQINAERALANLPPVQAGIGIHTGHMMVGMVGEDRRMQGDAFSDNVNLTSRVEGLTRYFNVSIILTEEALMRLEDRKRYHIRSLGRVRVKGKQNALTLYEVFDGEAPDVFQTRLDTLDDYEEALKLYLSGKLEPSQKLFEKVLAANPNDGPARLYYENCRRTLVQGLPSAWDGVENMSTK